jgi:hypothetical protein
VFDDFTVLVFVVCAKVLMHEEEQSKYFIDWMISVDKKE